MRLAEESPLPVSIPICGRHAHGDFEAEHHWKWDKTRQISSNHQAPERVVSCRLDIGLQLSVFYGCGAPYVYLAGTGTPLQGNARKGQVLRVAIS